MVSLPAREPAQPLLQDLTSVYASFTPCHLGLPAVRGLSLAGTVLDGRPMKVAPCLQGVGTPGQVPCLAGSAVCKFFGNRGTCEANGRLLPFSFSTGLAFGRVSFNGGEPSVQR